MTSPSDAWRIVRRRVLHGLCVFSAALLGPGGAQAVPVTLVAPLASGPVSTGQPLSGLFDLQATVQALNLVGLPIFQTGSVTFRFRDNDQPVTVETRGGSVVTSAFFSGPFGGQLSFPQPVYLESVLVTVADDVERARVTIGGQSAAAAPALVTSTVRSNPEPVMDRVQTPFGPATVQARRTACLPNPFGGNRPLCGTYDLWAQVTRSESYTVGDFSASIALDDASLADLGADLRLPFSVAADVGNFEFIDATLTLEVVDAGRTVDEPSLWMLLLVAAVAAGAIRPDSARSRTRVR